VKQVRHTFILSTVKQITVNRGIEAPKYGITRGYKRKRGAFFEKHTTRKDVYIIDFMLLMFFLK